MIALAAAILAAAIYYAASAIASEIAKLRVTSAANAEDIQRAIQSHRDVLDRMYRLLRKPEQIPILEELLAAAERTKKEGRVAE